MASRTSRKGKKNNYEISEKVGFLFYGEATKEEIKIIRDSVMNINPGLLDNLPFYLQLENDSSKYPDSARN